MATEQINNIKKGLDVEFDFPITIKKQYVQKSDDGGENWYIEGYAATSDFDLQGDIISRDCLEKSEHQLLDNSTVLYNHHDDQPIGRVVDSKLDENGLLLKILISKTEPDIWQKVQEGVLNKFSISAKVIKAAKKFVKELGTIANVIDEMFLLEVSLVSVPANPQAKAIGWYIGKALKEYEKKGGVIEMSKDLSTINKNDEDKLEAEVSKQLETAKAEDNIITDENGNPVVEETVEKAVEGDVQKDVLRATTNSLEVSGNGPKAAASAVGDLSDSNDGQPVKVTDDSLKASGNGSASGATASNPEANAGVTPEKGKNNLANPDAPEHGASNGTNPDAPQRGFRKGLGWLLITLEDMDEYLESPECVGVPSEVRTAVKEAIRAMSPASAAMDEVEDAMEAALLGKDATEVPTVEKSALELQVEALVKSNETLVSTVKSLQASMPVMRKGLIRTEEPVRTARDEMRDEVKKSANPEDALKTVLAYVHQAENGQ
jgi:HK97 family phage prohead protease